MLTRLVAVLLLLGSISINLSGLFVVAGFEMNKSYIASTLCINKDKPQLHCNGKCYLMKKLKQAQDKEEQEAHQFQKIQLQEAIVSLPFLFKSYTIALPALHVPLRTGMPLARVNAIFHPPQA